jgi:hypothetical protein
MPLTDASTDSCAGEIAARGPAAERAEHARPHLAGRETAHRLRSKTRQIRHLRVAVAALLVVLLVLAMSAILVTAKLNKVEAELLAVDSALRGTTRELRGLVENRLPGMHPLEFNTLLEIDRDYVVNISFSESGIGESKRIEYHAMLRNDSTGMILPRVTVLLFDEHGLQVGEERLDKMDATTDVLIEELRPGEARSYRETIGVKRGAVPVFFLIHID